MTHDIFEQHDWGKLLKQPKITNCQM
jgi:hypothetical protein